jgi:uncharacterized protein (DUF1015 family)
MVVIKPLQGIYFSREKVGDLSKVVTPPHDVISKEDQEEYYRRSPYNIVRLILGKLMPGDSATENQYTRAAAFLNKWLKEGVLVKDKKPAIYAYEQEFTLDNGSTKKQLGFIALVKLEPFEKKVILPHERIIPKMKDDRLRLMRACRANMSLIITAYSDKELASGRMLAAKTREKPFIEVSFGKKPCVHRVWVIHDRKFIEKFVSLFADKRLYIADGHHRYTTALEYHQTYDKTGASAYMMMFLLNMEGDGVTILPAHRVLKNIRGFDVSDVKKKIAKYFSVKEFPASDEGKFFQELESLNNENAFGMYCGNGRLYLLKLADACVMDDVGCDMPKVWRKLDVIILHSLIFGKILGLDGDKHAEKEDLIFVKERKKVLELVDKGEYQLAFFLNPTKMQQVKEAAEAGERMPQKSTYFYPKPLSGLVINKFD